MFWGLSACLTRLSLLCFYYRLKEHIKFRRYNWVLHIVIFVSVTFMIVFVFTLIFSCRPTNAFWSSDLHPKCFDVGRYLFSITVFNTCLELVCALLPMPVLWSIKMDRRQKWTVFVLLGLGIATTAVACVRCYFVYKAVVSNYDIVWWSEPHFITSEVENSVALVASSFRSYIILLIIV
jgi:hypothetical protein